VSENPVLAGLARLEEGQKAIREEMSALTEEMARLRTDLMAEKELTGMLQSCALGLPREQPDR
jgi:hypothetical protein